MCSTRLVWVSRRLLQMRRNGAPVQTSTSSCQQQRKLFLQLVLLGEPKYNNHNLMTMNQRLIFQNQCRVFKSWTKNTAAAAHNRKKNKKIKSTIASTTTTTRGRSKRSGFKPESKPHHRSKTSQKLSRQAHFNLYRFVRFRDRRSLADRGQS